MLSKTVFAAGADIKNRFLIAKGKELYFGPDTGDLADAANYETFKKEVFRLLKKVKTKPQIVVSDLHPDYFSVRFAKEYIHLFDESYKFIQVQHHHAHIGSVLAETHIRKPVIGVAFDGTGLGVDGNLWGGEFFVVDKCKFKRSAHLKYRMMPGGDKVVYEPWRMVLSILKEKGIPFLRNVKGKDKDLILSMMSKNINSPLSSSAGRLFDAAAALMGVCLYASYEAEGPIKLESMCDDKIEESYRFKTLGEDGCYIIDTEPVFWGIIKDLTKSRRKSIIATKFHNSMVEIITSTTKKLSGESGIKDIVLSGGVFQNNFLKKKVIKILSSSGFNVLTNIKTSVGDFNISLGQYYVSCCTSKS